MLKGITYLSYFNHQHFYFAWGNIYYSLLNHLVINNYFSKYFYNYFINKFVIKIKPTKFNFLQFKDLKHLDNLKQRYALITEIKTLNEFFFNDMLILVTFLFHKKINITLFNKLYMYLHTIYKSKYQYLTHYRCNNFFKLQLNFSLIDYNLYLYSKQLCSWEETYIFFIFLLVYHLKISNNNNNNLNTFFVK